MSHASSRINWRKWFFYGAEIIFAFISGNSESTIYQAYLPEGPLALVEANSRAIITQVAIVLFSIAFIEAAQMRGKGRAPAMLFIGGMNLAFSVVAFWFIREAALIYEHKEFLTVAWNQPLSIFGSLLNGQEIDVNLIASMPFFQVAMSWVGPFVVREHEAESEADMAARQKRELLELEHRNKRKVLTAKGWKDTVKAALSQEEDAPLPAESLVESGDNSGEIPAATVMQFPVKKSGNEWTYRELKDHVRAEFGIEITDDEAKNFVAHVGKQKRGNGPGRPYVASKRALVSAAKSRWVSGDKEDVIEA